MDYFVPFYIKIIYAVSEHFSLFLQFLMAQHTVGICIDSGR
jgi:hypothetical protein